MKIARKKELGALVTGDIFVLATSLFLALGLRYLKVPSFTTFEAHIWSFVFIFAVWVIVGYIAGLYEKHTALIKKRLPRALINTQVITTVLGIAFFYFSPDQTITPKVILFIYLIISFGLFWVWRVVLFPYIMRSRSSAAVIVGEGKDVDEVYQEVNNNPRYGLTFVAQIQPASDVLSQQILDAVQMRNVSMVVIDMSHPAVIQVLPALYHLVFKGVQFVDIAKMYEDIFDRVPLALVGRHWYVENISLSPQIVYDVLKRTTDVVVAAIIGIVSIFIYPFVMLAIKLDDGGTPFITQDRVGRNGKIIKIIKFRSMAGNDNGKYDASSTSSLVVTRVGKFIRKSRIDELPQLWNVIKGDLSLIGPRPELPSLVAVYEKEIPYYGVRHLIMPGLSGWAQIYHEEHPHHKVATQETRDKLSYDLYYIKNRSFLLDLKIALRTFQILMLRKGL